MHVDAIETCISCIRNTAEKIFEKYTENSATDVTISVLLKKLKIRLRSVTLGLSESVVTHSVWSRIFVILQYRFVPYIKTDPQWGILNFFCPPLTHALDEFMRC